MAEEIYYPAYESWDKSISIDETISDTLTLSWNADDSSSVVKIIFETFGVDPEQLPPDSAFVRLYILNAAIGDEGLCVTADYHHTRPITADDWVATSAGDALDAYPLVQLANAAGGLIDIPLTGLDGIRQCPTGIRFVILPEGTLLFDNSVTIDGFAGNKPELHLVWDVAPDAEDGGLNDSGPDQEDRAGELPNDADRSNPRNRDPRTPRHDQPREINEFALYAAMLAAAKQRPWIAYQASLKKGDDS